MNDNNNHNNNNSRAELEQSIAGLKKQLKAEHQAVALQRLVLCASQQSASASSSATHRAAVAERDDVVFDILGLQRAIHDQDFALLQARAKERELASKQEEEEEEGRRRKRARLLEEDDGEEDDDTRRLQREQHALRQLLFVLLMESGVDWTQDDAWREVVWSFR